MHPFKRTVRLRLTLLYGAVFLVSGAALLTITYVLVDTQLHKPLRVTQGRLPNTVPVPGTVLAPASARGGLRTQQAADLHQLLVQSIVALAIMAVLSVLLGWFVAGRALQPIRTMTAKARRISDRNLHERLALFGPRDELKDLGDTFDALLARLEAAFESQRQFVANASHELRTPLTLDRMMLQVALSDPDLTLDSLRSTCLELIDAGKHQQRLIEALLTLAQSQRGLDHRETFDLALCTAQVIQANKAAAASSGLRINATLDKSMISGDERLMSIMVSNLLQNASRYGDPGGVVDIDVSSNAGQATLVISNGGDLIPADDVERLTQPFQRLAGVRTANYDGFGLGLSIVAAIATAHDATLRLASRPGGGLIVHTSFHLLLEDHACSDNDLEQLNEA